MIYSFLGGSFIGASAYLLQKYSSVLFPQKTIITLKQETLPVLNHTFNKDTIVNYATRRHQGNKIIIQSRLHKCPLAIHKIITKDELKKSQTSFEPSKQSNQAIEVTSDTSAQKVQAINQNIQNSPSKEASQPNKVKEHKQLKNRQLYQRAFQGYAEQLLKSNKCETVELISGPIYPKDTPYKPRKPSNQQQKPNPTEQIDNFQNIYVSRFKVSQTGQYLSDKYYQIVICNQGNKHYYNGYTMRRSYAYPHFKLSNYLTSLVKIEQQTGLNFNIQGEKLFLHDFEGFQKERLYSLYEQGDKIQENK